MSIQHEKIAPADTGDNAPKPSLRLPVETKFEPLVEAFVREAGLAWGLPPETAGGLAQAARQIYGHLAQTSLKDLPVKLVCVGDPGAVQVDFTFSGRDSAAHAHRRIRRTRAPQRQTDSPGTDECMQSLIERVALAAAVGQVDRFSTTLEKTDVARLTLIKEKKYPQDNTVAPIPAFDRLGVFRPAVPEEIPLVLQRGRQVYGPENLPHVFRYPDKVADRLRRGETQALTALCQNGEICGAIFWETRTGKWVECCGPFVFTKNWKLAELLVEGMLHALAKRRIAGLVNTWPTPDFPAHEWEQAGTMTTRSSDDALHTAPVKREIYLRMMIEDAGCPVWAPPDLSGYLQKAYRRLALPRELRPPPEMVINGEAVLCAEYDRDENRITLRPLAAGRDAGALLADQVALLRRHGIETIRFELDLGAPFAGAFTPALSVNGFVPALLLPHGGEGDLLIFEQAAAPAR